MPKGKTKKATTTGRNLFLLELARRRMAVDVCVAVSRDIGFVRRGSRMYVVVVHVCTYHIDYIAENQWLVLVRGHFHRPLIRVYLCLFLPTGASIKST
jgi:hypothetical protein